MGWPGNGRRGKERGGEGGEARLHFTSSRTQHGIASLGRHATLIHDIVQMGEGAMKGL